MQARDWPSAQWAREDCREEQLCVKPEGGKGASPADMWEKSLPGCGNSKGKLHEVGVGLVCGKKNREREGKWEEIVGEAERGSCGEGIWETEMEGLSRVRERENENA